MLTKTRLILLIFPLLTGCEMLYEVLEIPDPKKEAAESEAEGRAVGSACRHAGRSIEDCYLLNGSYPKSAIFSGWKEMNDYMLANGMDTVPSKIPQPGERPAKRPQRAESGETIIESPGGSPSGTTL